MLSFRLERAHAVTAVPDDIVVGFEHQRRLRRWHVKAIFPAEYQHKRVGGVAQNTLQGGAFGWQHCIFGDLSGLFGINGMVIPRKGGALGN